MFSTDHGCPPLNSATGETIPGILTVFEVNEQSSWAATDSSARIGALIGLKCVPVGR